MCVIIVCVCVRMGQVTLGYWFMVIHSIPWESKHTSPSSVAVKARCSIEVVSLASGIFPENLNTKLPCEMPMSISTAQARTKQVSRD